MTVHGAAVPGAWGGAAPWFALLLFLCGIALAPPAHAQDHITERAFFEDKSDTLDFAAARDQDYRVFTGLLSQGFSRSAFWIRLRIEPGAPTPEGRLIVRVRPSYLDQISLYDPAFQTAGPVTSGDLYPVSRDAYPSLYFNFAIPQGAAPRTIWLRLKTTSTNLMHVGVLSPEQALQRDRHLELAYAPYLSLLLLFLIWGVWHWVQSREALLGAFVLKQALALPYALSFLGYFRLFWPDAVLPFFSPSLLSSLSIIFVAVSAYLFDFSLLRECRANRWLLRLNRLLTLPFALALLLLALGDVRRAMTLANILIFVLPLLSLVTALSIPGNPPGEVGPSPLPKRYALGLYSLILLSLVLSSLAVMGLLGVTERAIELTLNGYLSYTLWTGLAVLILLQIRARRLAQHRIELEIAYGQAQQRTALEAAKRLEMERFLAMLTHELKTPLAVVRMVLGARRRTPALTHRAEHAIEDMSAIIERCMLADRLDNTMVEPRIAPCDIEALLRELIAARPAPERFELEAAAHDVQTDSGLLRIIAANLLDNALKYAPPESPITLRLESATQDGIEGVALEVDNLPGKSGRPDPERVFDKYYRHPKAHRVTGSGLGLFLCAGVARLLKGRLDYRPTPTHIRFRLWIPRCI